MCIRDSSNIPYYSEEEELLLWSETSLRGPLITAGYERYMELFKKILPQKAEPVSYTHLDVYKRQVLVWIPWR